ncbi:hypothetical protein KSC_072150 [Ktedonobacter sp. SOSP1-52]|uniref:hypothetical protein n=1 Tax=Ktedonobacter sp. SOSP1-52 TaxID=2778366 RepID=UPI001A250438|nr:hypothetical protein [Ktedonobacter sp. SOSP1-52]GHO68323.1 hypothetical protein KSC_072150 [Ktedonobacter sp. SOSP1-52]
MTRSSVTIQITPEPLPSTPSWMGEVAAFAQVLSHTGILKALQEQVRFARARFGQYDLIDFVAVLLPQTDPLPAPHRRFDQVCAPGYHGRKRGEVVRTRTVVLQAHTHQLLGTFGGPGNGDYRGELRRAIGVITSYATHEEDAHMEHVDTDQLRRLSHALHTLPTSPLDPNGEPPFLYLTDPPGKPLLQAYRENLPPRPQRRLLRRDSTT